MEIEAKYRVTDEQYDTIRLALYESMGPPRVEDQRDEYFIDSTKSYVARIRNSYDDHILTVKNIIPPSEIKIRIEEETEIGSEQAMIRILETLGFEHLGTVIKHRCGWLYSVTDPGPCHTICLDDVEGLGKFLEIELNKYAVVDSAADAIRSIIQSLNVTDLEPVSNSYIALQLQRSK